MTLQLVPSQYMHTGTRYRRIVLTEFQPAIDAFALDMMRRFNKLPAPRKRTWFSFGTVNDVPSQSMQPLIYNTFQAYLRRYVLLCVISQQTDDDLALVLPNIFHRALPLLVPKDSHWE